MQLCNRSDGVNGHYCIGRYNHDGQFWEYWTEHSQSFTSAGTVYVGEKIALAKLQELKSPNTDTDMKTDPHYKTATMLLETAELRDKFAMAAMVGFAKNYRSATGYTKGGNVDKGMKLDAQLAYGFADAMLEARKLSTE